MVKIKPGESRVDIQIVGEGDLGGASEKMVTLTLRPGSDYALGATDKAKVKIMPSNVVVLS